MANIWVYKWENILIQLYKEREEREIQVPLHALLFESDLNQMSWAMLWSYKAVTEMILVTS